MVKKGVACPTVSQWSWAEFFFLVGQWPQMQNVINYRERLGEKVFSEQPYSQQPSSLQLQ